MSDIMERTETALLRTVLILADSPNISVLERSCASAVRMWIGVHAFGFQIFGADGTDQKDHLYMEAERHALLEQSAFTRLLRGRSLAHLFRTAACVDNRSFLGHRCWSEVHEFDYHGVPALYEIVAGPMVIAGDVVGTLLIGGFQILAETTVGAFSDRELNRLEAIGAAASIALSRIDGRAPGARSLRTWEEIRQFDIEEASAQPGIAMPSSTDAAFAGIERLSIADRSLLMRLPPRLETVARLLCEGKTNKAIAIDLRISPHTVRDHVQKLCRRFDCATRTELIFKLVTGAARG